MNRRRYLAMVGAAASTTAAGCAARGGSDSGSNSTAETDSGTDADDGSNSTTTEYVVETVAEGFTHPWALCFLPDDAGLLVTERAGRVVLVDRDSGDVTRVSDTPTVFARGQGGMLDVALHPRYPDEPWMYLTYSVAGSGGSSTTAVGRGLLDVENARLGGFERLHAAEPFVESAGHYGSRLAFDADERLYVTVGDRQFKNFGPNHTAQDLTTEHGAVLRFEADGSVPSDNPFVDDPDARDTVFSYGHRNPQGLTVHPDTGDLWESEYGEQDGDEINVLTAGANYGWPVADEGCTYGSGDPIGVSHDDRDDVVAPAYTWPCGSGGFPPGGMTFCSGRAFPEWAGQLFVGGLATRALGRLTVDGRTATPVERLLTGRGWRIRTVTEAPDTGHLYIAVDAGDAPVVRLRPP
jgi:quinoprotein glucose dehydrogenase